MLIDIHTETDSGDIITLEQDLRVVWQGRVIFIRAGFESDGASVPRFLWGKISPAIDPRTLRGAIAHDYLYRYTPAGWTRKEADQMFYDIIRQDGLEPLAALAAYIGVRLFGKSSWRGK